MVGHKLAVLFGGHAVHIAAGSVEMKQDQGCDRLPLNFRHQNLCHVRIKEGMPCIEIILFMADNKTIPYSRLSVHLVKCWQLTLFALPDRNAFFDSEADVITCFLFHGCQKFFFALA